MVLNQNLGDFGPSGCFVSKFDNNTPCPTLSPDFGHEMTVMRNLLPKIGGHNYIFQPVLSI